MDDIINFKKGNLVLLDQRRLPFKKKYKKISSSASTARAIKDMVVRGAPAIGITAAYGYYLGSLEAELNNYKKLKRHMDRVKKKLLDSRPTAVNLQWALNSMEKVFTGSRDLSLKELRGKLYKQAEEIKNSEIEANREIGRRGSAELKKIAAGRKIKVLTHCNAGALATGGWGTALGVIRSAFKDGIISEVFADETRPRLQGARLTCWELKEEEIPCRLITDGMSGFFMSRGEIDAVVVGADRIALNGDVANKIGTSMVAVAAGYYNVPFYVAAPVSTFDFNCPTGGDIQIEERSHREVLEINGKKIAPQGTKTSNPAFDITEKKLISGYITEKGVLNSADELQ
ncbi:MAG: S-methyl-5-thioribose-1-phosphate isomerase [Elusimicrobiota bacterium]|nr:S-methyl-5-thioribose-1-phosphate isomerase [Elusimicrobiota bacterium]